MDILKQQALDVHRVHPVRSLVHVRGGGARIPDNSAQGGSSFSAGVRLAVQAAQLFSILPMSWSGPHQTRFAWASLRVAYSVAITLAIAGRLLYELLFKKEESDSQTVGHIGTVSAHMIAAAISLLYVWLASHWQELAELFRRMEGLLEELRCLPPGKSILASRLRTTTIAFIIAASIEHLSDKATALGSSMEKSDPPTLQGMVERSIQSQPALQLAVWIFFEVVASFMAILYVFNDVFLILVSTTILYYMRSLNNFVRMATHQVAADKSFWSRTRVAYSSLAKLTREVDGYLNINVLITFTQNLFFICFQLLYFLRNTGEGSARRYFRISSFAYVLLRTIIVAMSLASINDASKTVRLSLFSVPSRNYCKEVFRLTQQVTTDEIGLTGCQFFRVTRSFILTIVGTVATYEIILLQFNKK